MTDVEESRLKDIIEDLKLIGRSRSEIIQAIRLAGRSMNPVTSAEIDDFINRNNHLLPPDAGGMPPG